MVFCSKIWIVYYSFSISFHRCYDTVGEFSLDGFYWDMLPFYLVLDQHQRHLKQAGSMFYFANSICYSAKDH